MQRFFDIVLSGTALVVLAPLLVPVVLILRFTGEGEIFFVQRRIGRGGQPFGLLKFASMLKDSPHIGTGTVTVKDDPRVLPVGRVLRKTKINELPQLLNVLKGDMSLIGPRPQEERCFRAFPGECRDQIVRVRPGLSGVGSIAFRDEEALLDGAADPDAFYDRVIMPHKGALEAWYVGHASLRTYLLCILATLWVVLFPAKRIEYRLFPGLPAEPEALRMRREPEGTREASG